MATAARPWNPCCIRPRSALAVASRGPRPRGRGIRPVRSAAATICLASMWPRPRGRGIAICRRVRCSRHARFNVATAARPWNRRFATHPEPFVKASMWPRPRGRGIPVDPLRPRRRSRASMWPRPRGRGIIPSPTVMASFAALQCGPRPRRPWNRCIRRMRSCAYRRFNAATAARPWNRRKLTDITRAAIDRLQCGHGRAAVELLRGTAGIGSPAELQCGHGRAAVESDVHQMTTAALKLLQCGHGRAAVESGPGNRVHLAPRGFNVATAARPWNPTCPPAVGITTDRLQCGHGRAAVESPRRWLFLEASRLGFNVATAARPWNHWYTSKCQRNPEASMWPRPRGRGISPSPFYSVFNDLRSHQREPPDFTPNSQLFLLQKHLNHSYSQPLRNRERFPPFHPGPAARNHLPRRKHRIFTNLPFQHPCEQS